MHVTWSRTKCTASKIDTVVKYEKENIYEYHNLNQLDLNKGIETVSNTEFI